MGQYRISFYFKYQIGFLISYDETSMISINIPFVEINIATSKDAYGFRFFKD